MATNPPEDTKPKPKSYYGYLIEGDGKEKRASPVLEALLKAIGQYIVRLALVHPLTHQEASTDQKQLRLTKSAINPNSS